MFLLTNSINHGIKFTRWAILIIVSGSARPQCRIGPFSLLSLVQLDHSVALYEYGFVVAADATAQMIVSPIFGFFTDR